MQFWFSSNWNVLTALILLLVGLWLTSMFYHRPRSRQRIVLLVITLLLVLISSLWLGAVLQYAAIDPAVRFK